MDDVPCRLFSPFLMNCSVFCFWLIYLSINNMCFCVDNLMQRIQYAKTKSDCIAKEEGSYVPREKKKKQEEKGEQFSFIVL